MCIYFHYHFLFVLELEQAMAAPVQTSDSNSKDKKNKDEELFYLPPPVTWYQEEGVKEKMIRKTKENPFVPLGVAFTTVVLGIGISTLRTGDGKKAQLMMRLRVGGQAFAIFAMLGGVYYHAKYKKED